MNNYLTNKNKKKIKFNSFFENNLNKNMIYKFNNYHRLKSIIYDYCCKSKDKSLSNLRIKKSNSNLYILSNNTNNYINNEIRSDRNITYNYNYNINDNFNKLFFKYFKKYNNILKNKLKYKIGNPIPIINNKLNLKSKSIDNKFKQKVNSNKIKLSYDYKFMAKYLFYYYISINNNCISNNELDEIINYAVNNINRKIFSKLKMKLKANNNTKDYLRTTFNKYKSINVKSKAFLINNIKQNNSINLNVTSLENRKTSVIISKKKNITKTYQNNKIKYKLDHKASNKVIGLKKLKIINKFNYASIYKLI